MKSVGPRSVELPQLAPKRRSELGWIMVARSPERWMRLRHPDGFTVERFAQFCALCRIFRAYVEATLAETASFKFGSPSYVFFEAELSEDRRIASLPLGGIPTIGSGAMFENGSSWMLWHRLPLEFREHLEEGLSENLGDGLRTNWRTPTQSIWFSSPSPNRPGR